MSVLPTVLLLIVSLAAQVHSMIEPQNRWPSRYRIADRSVQDDTERFMNLFRTLLNPYMRTPSKMAAESGAVGPAVRKRQTQACPASEDGRREFLCPAAGGSTAVCVDDHQLCNGTSDCPNGEDENTVICLFYRAIRSNMNLLVQQLITVTK